MELKNKYYDDKNCIEAGVDEAGRGCLFGPVHAAIVLWDPSITIPSNIKITDSKKMTKLQRDKAYKYIIENAIDWSVGYCDPAIIDEINILNATKRAMRRAFGCLNVRPDVVLIDGNQTFSSSVMPNRCVTDDKDCEFITVLQGDSKFVSIAAASILAKVSHDNYIVSMCNEDPTLDYKYNLRSNMGYGTKNHRDGIKQHGLTPLHRHSFKLK